MAFDASPPPSSANCPFCNIATSYPPASPSSSSQFSSTALSTSASKNRPSHEHPSRFSLANHDLVSPPSFLVLSTPLCVAFLDIMPLSPGHLLLTTRRHHEKITDITVDEARELGVWLGVLSRCLINVTGVEDFNIVQNNGAAAAQVVPHVHFHIIPRPALTPELRNRSFTMFGRGQRSELDDDEAKELAHLLREELAKEMVRMGREKL